VILGLLPELGGGLGTLEKAGQHVRFVEGYLRPYGDAFEQVRYFSYRSETVAQFTRDAALAARVRVFPGAACHPWLYAGLLPFRHGRALAECSVLRVFHLAGAIPALVARRRSGVPFVTTYGFRYDLFARTATRAWLHRRLANLVLAEADAVIVTTPELATYVAERARSPKAVHLVPNGVDTRVFRPMPRPPTDAPSVLYVGRLSPQKNLSSLIAAAAKLRGRLDVTLRFVGDGVLRQALADEAAAAGVNLDLMPVVDHSRLPSIYNAADVFALPSFIEGHPKVLLEAMSCGLPCIASNVAGSRTTIVDGRTGLLVDPNDPGALADAIERLITDRKAAQALGEAARRKVVEHYDLAMTVAQEIELLRRIAGDGRR
jgi:glycosyltransferase involved in cell wall biosynthesis